MMKKTLFALLMITGALVLKAQDEPSFTDEDLTKYATVMVWAEQEKENLGSIVSDSVAIWIDGTALDVSTYIALSKSDKNGELESAEASEDQIMVYQEVQTKIEDKKANFKEVYVSKIKEDIGAGLYNSLRKAMKADADLKARYVEIETGLKEASEAEKSESDTE